MGEPWFKLAPRAKEWGLVAPLQQLRALREISVRVMELLGRHSAWLEVYSIDEAFLGVKGTPTQLLALGGVFIGDGTYCPGFQLLAGCQLHPTMISLFRRALELGLSHNYFTAWTITPSATLGGARPVDSLRQSALLNRALEGFATDLPG